MASTAFSSSDEMRARSSAVHARLPDGSLMAIEFGLPPEPEFQMGGGGLNSTVEDYSQFLQMILGRGTRDGVQVLRPETVDQMTVNNMGDVRVVALPAVTSRPRLATRSRNYTKHDRLYQRARPRPLATGGGVIARNLQESIHRLNGYHPHCG